MVAIFCLFFGDFLCSFYRDLCRIGTKHEIRYGNLVKTHWEKTFQLLSVRSTWKVIRQHEHDIMCVNNLVKDEDMLMDDTAQTLHKAVTSKSR
jgi:AICAR transformylase/IMP cyclohydrolase PurH